MNTNYTNNTNKRLVVLVLFACISILALLPFTASANIWDKTGPPGGPTCNIGGPCTFCDALKVIHNIIMFMFEIAIPLAVAMIVYGAIRFMIAGGNENNVKEARKIMMNAFIGMLIALGAWIIVNTLLHILTGKANFPWNNISCS